ncbi:hypothetical protein [Mesorhizobium sp. GbtcB19]|uniref:hypothetical protein n=1 Tax=Mesorhizobium sp. GbtcB19 TaxID=2824764 RepID=UPI001C30CA3B|nr:hypothetical protein [Mesorhizobium sp. GbtcB19]
MQRPGEWPIWHDNDQPGERDIGAPQRHEIALARYLEKQHAHRAAAVRRTSLSTAAATAGWIALRILQSILVLAGKAIERIDEVGVNLSKAHREISAPRKHR